MDQTTETELGTIERELHIDAAPEIVFEVVSRPEHVGEWWPDDARFEPVAGAAGELEWRDAATGETTIVSMNVEEVDPPRHFSFRWCHVEPDRTGPSLLVTFDLAPAAGGGTTLRMVETGFREMGWEVAHLEEQYQDHVSGWAHYLPILATYAAGVAASR